VRFTPLRMLLFLIAFVHATAVVFFVVSPTGLARDLPSYLETMMLGGVFLVSTVPPLFAFTYYILEASFLRKAFFTLACMAHLAVFIPLQYALHAFIVHHGSLVMLPLLYMLFGVFVDVFLMVAFYALAVGAIRGEDTGKRRVT
jgi:hypothetical protein